MPPDRKAGRSIVLRTTWFRRKSRIMAYRRNSIAVTDTEIEALKNYRTQGSLALSAYIDLSSADLKSTADHLLKDRIEARLRELDVDINERGSLQEDLELIEIYLNTNGNRRAAGVAVFSCAEELFWRAYLLPVPVDMHVHIGSELDPEPLVEVFERIRGERLTPETMAV